TVSMIPVNTVGSDHRPRPIEVAAEPRVALARCEALELGGFEPHAMTGRTLFDLRAVVLDHHEAFAAARAAITGELADLVFTRRALRSTECLDRFALPLAEVALLFPALLLVELLAESILLVRHDVSL